MKLTTHIPRSLIKTSAYGPKPGRPCSGGRKSEFLTVKFGLAAIAAGLMLAVPVFAAPASTFDTGLDGWTGEILNSGFLGSPPSVLGSQTPGYNASGGNPGGYVTMFDVSGSAEPHFVAPAKFLGNDSAYYGGALAFDLIDNLGIQTPEPNFVELVGNGHTLFYTDSIVGPPNTWTSYSIILAPSADWRFDNLASGSIPTVAQFQSVLSNLQELNIEADLANGGDTGGLDNVRLSPSGPTVPDSGSTMALLGGVLTALAAFRRRV